MQEIPVYSCVQKICWWRDRLPTPVFLGLPGGSVGKESACNVGDLGSIPELGRSPGEGNSYPIQYSGLENFMDCRNHGREGNGNPLQYSCLENPRDRGAWWAAVYGVTQNWTWLKRFSSSSSSRVHGVTKSPTWLNNFHFQTLGSVFYTSYIFIIFWCIQWSRLVFSQIQQNHFVLYFPSSHPSPRCYFSGIFRI